MKMNLLPPERFAGRHIGPGEMDTTAMLETIGLPSLDRLIEETVPSAIRLGTALELPPAETEDGYLRRIARMASENKVFRSYIGQGYYDTVVPGVIRRNILENPGWYTQYTPYQAEISQGRLEALLNFQTMVTDLTGMEFANASLLDESTAAAEAMAMQFALRTNKAAGVYFVSEDIFPQTLRVLETRAGAMGITLLKGDHRTTPLEEGIFGAVVQYPAGNGEVFDYTDFAARCHQKGIKLSVIADLMSLALLKPPSEFGADVVVGSTQRFGVPMGFGGPHAAYFATKAAYKRAIPGRIIGVSVDAENRPALRMALQTREQHIRREKATSNICTAQALLAIMAGMYAVYHGGRGIKAIAGRIHGQAAILSEALEKLGYRQLNGHFFDTLCIDGGELSASIHKDAVDKGINFRYFAGNRIGISLDETTTWEDLREIVAIFARIAGRPAEDLPLAGDLSAPGAAPGEITVRIPDTLLRQGEVLEHPVFSRYHSEHEMLRYIKRLESRDLSLTQSMIPLGSCTMKLNATTEMLPVTWPEFCNIHPFAPADQTGGYMRLISELEKALCEITGFSAFSFQPNSGAQGEYTGLLVIRQYHRDRGEAGRNVVLIPASAHGTNPASATIAGMKVVVVRCDDAGNIDLADLGEKAAAHRDELAALMVTYPSTHGVFEEQIMEICSVVHQHGGQVYMDGANMNAQVGLTSPALVGADVCHLNLHKTFCIPHGGGGPGMGPIGVAEHLKPFLPGHPALPSEERAIDAVAAAPWGSAGILVISHAYICMMGAAGLRDATRYAILNANYLKARLEKHYPVLYTGKNGRVGHEMILDCRAFKSFGVEVGDIAKRLMDYGFHAPTVSFPVAGTLMVEPTESESKEELDRFCEAMISIRQEIEEIASQPGNAVNLLKMAPHTAAVIAADEWDRPYSRAVAAFPLDWVRERKFWPAVSRINDTYGDRNLVCTCPPMEAYS